MTTQGLQESTGAKDAATYVAKGSDAASTLRKALELLGPNGDNWGQGNGMQGPLDGKLCALDALCGAHGLTGVSGLDPFVDANHFGRASTVPAWNDAPGRTFPEVKAAFEKAIQLAEQEAKS